MSEYRERRTVIEDVPIKRARPVGETQYDSVVHESRGMSGGAIAALVLASVAVAVLFTMLILNNQRNSDEELAQERARAAAAQQAVAPPQPQQPSSQQPPVVVMPQTQPGVTPVPAPDQPSPSKVAPTSTELELDVTTKLLDDQDLRVHTIDVKVTAGTAVLSGNVPNDELKMRAEALTRTVKGVRGVINNLVVKPE